MSVFISAFAHKNLKLQNPDDLNVLHIGYKRGVQNARNLLTNLYSAKNIIATDDNEMSFRMLAKGRLDVINCESVMGNGLIKDNPGFKDLVEISHIQELQIYSYIHHKHRSLGDKIAATLDTMKQDGTFARITAESIANFEIK